MDALRSQLATARRGAGAQQAFTKEAFDLASTRALRELLSTRAVALDKAGIIRAFERWRCFDNALASPVMGTAGVIAPTFVDSAARPSSIGSLACGALCTGASWRDGTAPHAVGVHPEAFKMSCASEMSVAAANVAGAERERAIAAADAASAAAEAAAAAAAVAERECAAAAAASAAAAERERKANAALAAAAVTARRRSELSVMAAAEREAAAVRRELTRLATGTRSPPDDRTVACANLAPPATSTSQFRMNGGTSLRRTNSQHRQLTSPAMQAASALLLGRVV